MLDRSPVLIAEDEPFIALDIAMAIEDAGGEVVGPAASVEAALALLGTRTVSAAILDANLVDGDVSPVVECLVANDIPFIIQSGVGLPAELASRFPHLVARIKPLAASDLVGELAALLGIG